MGATRYKALTSFNLAGEPINADDVLPDEWPGQNAHQIAQLIGDKVIVRLPDEVPDDPHRRAP